MRTVTTTDSNRDEFEDTLFNPNLVVVQKEINGFLNLTQIVYVYANVDDQSPIYGIFREISEEGTDYWKETYNAQF